jgi:hypothetical protein
MASNKTVTFTYSFGGWTFDGEAEVNSEEWDDAEKVDRVEMLREAAIEEFTDGVEVAEDSINDN